MSDVFSLVAPHEMESPAPDASPPVIRKWMTSRNWLLPPAGISVRDALETCLAPQRVSLDPVMELESFDLMLQFVSMGMGCAFVPRRSLAGFPRKRRIKTIPLPLDVQRTLVVIAPSATKVPEHVATFIDGILFS